VTTQEKIILVSDQSNRLTVGTRRRRVRHSVFCPYSYAEDAISKTAEHSGISDLGSYFHQISTYICQQVIDEYFHSEVYM
jgi:hypothetical protein